MISGAGTTAGEKLGGPSSKKPTMGVISVKEALSVKGVGKEGVERSWGGGKRAWSLGGEPRTAWPR